jgi:hypothetical protein
MKPAFTEREITAAIREAQILSGKRGIGQCNFCTLERIRERAEKNKSTVVVRSAYHEDARVHPDGFIDNWPDAMDVYVIPEGEQLSQGHWVAMFLSLPDKCAC